VIAAFLGARGDRAAIEAVVAAHVVYGIAAERAAALAAGSGTFASHLLDALGAVSPEDVRAGARVRDEDPEPHRARLGEGAADASAPAVPGSLVPAEAAG
jgi:hydroxyethylthiazole kinase